jgi:threonine/homoserine/homoserine lactone efflux protein
MIWVFRAFLLVLAGFWVAFVAGTAVVMIRDSSQSDWRESALLWAGAAAAVAVWLLIRTLARRTPSPDES